MRVDFHLHTMLSDGTLKPEALLAAVRQARLEQWAVTDHDTLAGFRALRGEAGLVPGVEVTAGLDGSEIHIIALGIDPDDAAFGEFLAAIRSLRRERLTGIIDGLGLSLKISLESLRRFGADSLSRNHLARELVAIGRVTSFAAAFDELLRDVHLREFNLPSYPSPSEAIKAIHAAGGVALLAHPGLYETYEKIVALLSHGFDGLEIKHPNLDPALGEQLDAHAREHDLLVSCGSDLHYLGARQPGEWRLPRERLAPLLERIGASGLAD
jgi:3',5'-nucleoside bisphosphate phosphatase